VCAGGTETCCWRLPRPAAPCSGAMHLDTLLDISLQCTQFGNRAHLLHGCTFPGMHWHVLVRKKVKQPQIVFQWKCPCYWVLLTHTQLCGAAQRLCDCVCMLKGLQELVAHCNSAAALTCSNFHGSANAMYDMQASPSCKATVKQREQSARRCARICSHWATAASARAHPKCAAVASTACQVRLCIARQVRIHRIPDAHRLDPMSMDPRQCTNGADLEPRSNCRAGHC
jgi:hypothetical protein